MRSIGLIALFCAACASAPALPRSEPPPAESEPISIVATPTEASPPPRPSAPRVPRPAPSARADALPAPLPVRSRVELPLGGEPERPTRLAHVAALRPALRRCAGPARVPLSAAFGTCACEVMCRARFPEDEATTTFRFPFLDVDGLAFTIEPDGHVSACEYSVGANRLADVECP